MALALVPAATLVACTDVASPPPPDGTPVAPTAAAPPTQLWFVELDAPPVIRGGLKARIRDQHTAFLADALVHGVAVTPRYRMTGVWNGMSVRVATSDVLRLYTLVGVKRLFPVLKTPPPVSPDLPPGGGTTPELATSVGMIGGDIAHNTLGLTGNGVRVGVIDTGIDYMHPDLGGCFGPGCRVAFGHDLVGDAYNDDVSGAIPIPDDDPRDTCAGHGVHVSGIIGANGTVVGVAPKVTFGAYRVFGCAGSTSDDIILQAMDLAYADNVRVINMSLGLAFTWPDYPTSTASNELRAHGVVVVTSIGNSGTSGLYSTGSPGNAPGSIGTASIDNVGIAQFALQITPSTTMANNGLVGYTPASGGVPVPKTGGGPLTRTGTTTTTNDGCNPFAPGALTGQVALIRRGTCSFFQKSSNAQNAGAIGVVLYNNQPGQVSPTVAGTPPITIPVGMITQADGAAVNAQLDAGPAAMAWTSTIVSQPNPTGGQVSSFSSWGPNADLTFKPDLAAPGGSIFSTWPIALGSYASLSGTSMASPHVAGAAALLIEARPGVTPIDIMTLLQNTAAPAVNPTLGVPSPTQLQGAGLIRVDLAATTQLTVTPSSLALGESAAGPQKRTLTVHNTSTDTVTLQLSHKAAATVTGTTFAPVQTAAMPALVAVSSPTVTVGPGDSASVDVTITADAGLTSGNLYGGYIVFTPQDGKPPLSVPYQGLGGDYQAIKILNGTLPVIERPVGNGTFTPLPTGGTFTLFGADVPALGIHFDHFARHLHVDVVDTGGKPAGVFIDEDFDSRSSAAATRSVYTMPGGQVVKDKQLFVLPNGDYVFQLSALKALGDPSNPADTETWTSPVFTIDHP